MAKPTPAPPNGAVSPVRHWGGFLAAGLLALATDAGVLHLLADGLGLSPLVARPPSIAVAMVVSWWVNRTITFARATPPTWSEFAAFAAVSWAAQAVNYGVFAAILISFPSTSKLAALVLASLVSMIVSYAGFRFGVFRSHDGNGAN